MHSEMFMELKNWWEMHRNNFKDRTDVLANDKV